MQADLAYVFGPYRLEARRRRLTRDDEPVALSSRQADILGLLVSRAGQIVSKDELIGAAWKDVAVSDNSLEQAMSSLRRLLGPAPDGSSYIETLARRGYRFTAAVAQSAARQTDEALAAMIAPYRMFLEGRAAVETLERGAVSRACDAFRQVVSASPDYAPGHVGLANALALGFDASRGGEAPDLPALEAAIHHAREACRLDAGSGEVWATLAFVLSRAGAGADAVAAGRRATSLEPDNWRHHVRLAYATWGEERLRAARDATRLLPDLAIAHWLAASVHVARQALGEAARALTAGAAAQDRQPEGGRFGLVGLHLLLGLVRLAQGEEAAAEAELARELAAEHSDHLYAHQAYANTCCAIGAIRVHQSRAAEGIAAFERAIERVPGHALALAALGVVADGERRAAARSRLDARLVSLEAHGAAVDAAVARAVGDVLAGRHQAAADRVHDALRRSPERGSAGWTLPVEPLLQVSSHQAEWADVLAALRTRAA